MISLLSNIYKSTQVREIGVKVCLFFETVCLRLNNKYCNQLFFFQFLNRVLISVSLKLQFG